MTNNAVLTAIGEFIYIHLQKFDSENNRIARFLDYQNSKRMRLSPKVASGAFAYARLKRAEVVFCGHTHEAMQAETQTVRYFNSGCWINETPTYITIDESGIAIHDYVEEQMGFEAALRDASNPHTSPIKRSLAI